MANPIKRSHIWFIPADEFRQIMHSSASLSDAIRKLGLKPIGSNHKTVKARCLAEGIDVKPIIAAGRQSDGSTARRQAKPINDVLVIDSGYHPGQLKKRLIASGMLLNRCALCGLGPQWNGMPLRLHLDHINGISNDNRLSNLRLLCPNCHSQTPTYTGRNSSYIKSVVEAKFCIGGCGAKVSNIGNRCHKCAAHESPNFRIAWPDPAVLIEDVNATSYVAVARKLGVSDKAVKKHIARYRGLETPLFGLV